MSEVNTAEQNDIKRWKEEFIRGRRTQQFVDSAFFKLYFDPDLQAKIDFKNPEGLPAGGLWDPSCNYGIEKTAMGSAFNGGRFKQIEDIYTMINTWLKQGQEAEENLKRKGISL